MAYEPMGFDALLALLLADYRNRVNGADTSVDSEIYMRVAITAGVVWQAMYGIRYVEDQIFPESADSANLRRHARNYDISPNAAQAADDGVIELTGTNGTIVAIGLSLAHDDGQTYTTTSGGTIASGVLEVQATADVGAAGNRSIGQVLTVQSPPVGVDAEASVTTAFTNGADAESDAALLSRLLLRIRQGNAGGTASDYEQWALEVDGVAFAYCLPLRLGAGTVDVAVFQADANGHRVVAGSTLRTEVLAKLNEERPVTANVGVPALTQVVQNLVLTGMVLAANLVIADVHADMEAAYGDLVRSIPPGGTLYRVQIIRAVGAVAGVYTFTVATPAADVASTVSPATVQFLAPGTVTAT